VARSRRKLLWTSTTYFGEGLPWSFLHQMCTEFLTEIGASNTQISSTSLLHLAVTFKFAWSPIVDLFGRKRTWLWVMQLVLGAGMLVVAAVSPTRNLTLFWGVVGLLSILHATHDIACDGFYLQALDRHDQALFSGTRLGAYRLALIVGSSLLVALAGETSWFWGFAAAGGVMIAVAFLNAAVMPHPPERHPQETEAAGEHRPGVAFLNAFRSFLTQPKAPLVLSFMLLYRLGDIMMFTMSKPLLRDLGVNQVHRGLLNGVGGVASIAALIVAGLIVARKGLERCLVPMIYLQNLSIPLYIGMAVWKPHFPVIMAIYIAEQIVAGFGMAAATVFIMQRCRKAYAASHEHVLRFPVGAAQREARASAVLHGGVPGQRAEPGAGVVRPEDAHRGGARGGLTWPRVRHSCLPPAPARRRPPVGWRPGAIGSPPSAT
jgi:PAT family beta-lactamase induction signal transducer AmpG